MDFNSRDKKTKVEKLPSDKMSIVPKKDWHLFAPNSDAKLSTDLNLEQGVEIEIPTRFANGLKTEGVI